MLNKIPVNIFWFRRDLRLIDNAGLFHALRSGVPVLPIFIFDKNILDKLEDRDDSRVSFIHQSLIKLNNELKELGASLLVKHSTPVSAFEELLTGYDVNEVFTNGDYEPYATIRDEEIGILLAQKGVKLNAFKDHVIFEKNEIVKDDKNPYTVFTPYKRKWLEKMQPEFHLKAYPTLKYSENFIKDQSFHFPELSEIGFKKSSIVTPEPNYASVLQDYESSRDYPGTEGTSRLGIHLRFGTISIREVAKAGLTYSQVWLSELIWRDFYSMIMWHFPYSANQSFKKEFDNIRWINNEKDFQAWCGGQTGYPIVDAGMRQLNATGWMHNRVRMIVASFLTKHLLIDWRWGEAYFARKLLDYDQASNVGGWQWAAGTGNDAAPYFRVFSPDLQTKKFDPKLAYIKKWIPEFEDPFKYVKPVVEHKFARERALKAYKEALSKI